MVERNLYGATETNGLENGREYHQAFQKARTVPWTTPGLRITRLRLLSDFGYPEWDVSYCHGRLDDENVVVELPFSSLPKKNRAGAIVQHAKRDKVFAKGLGIFEAISELI